MTNPQRPSDLATELLTGGLPMLALAIADLARDMRYPSRRSNWVASLRERMGEQKHEPASEFTDSLEYPDGSRACVTCGSCYFPPATHCANGHPVTKPAPPPSGDAAETDWLAAARKAGSGLHDTIGDQLGHDLRCTDFEDLCAALARGERERDSLRERVRDLESESDFAKYYTKAKCYGELAYKWRKCCIDNGWAGADDHLLADEWQSREARISQLEGELSDCKQKLRAPGQELKSELIRQRDALDATNRQLTDERDRLREEVNRLTAEVCALKMEQPYRDEEMRQQGRTERDGEVAELRHAQGAAQCWIPVSERMPEPCKPILFVSDGATYSGNWGGDRVWWSETEDAADSHPDFDVTHWMHFPPPPALIIDQPSQPAPEPEPRAIVVGSTWRYSVSNGALVTIEGVDDRTVHIKWQDSGERRAWPIEAFRKNFTHVSDPPAEATSPPDEKPQSKIDSATNVNMLPRPPATGTGAVITRAMCEAWLTEERGMPATLRQWEFVWVGLTGVVRLSEQNLAGEWRHYEHELPGTWDKARREQWLAGSAPPDEGIESVS